MTSLKCAVVVLLIAASVGGAQDTKCAIDSTARWAIVSRNWSRETGTTWSNDSLRRILLALQRKDQADRSDFAARVTDSTYVRRLIELDRQTSAVVQDILDRFGLPTRSMVGAAGTSAVFLVVQHSATLQERVLELAKRAPAGEVAPSALAMLEDRVLANSGKPHVYGTHFTLSADGQFRLAPVADAAGMPLRREKAGLPPLDLYVCLFEESGAHVDRRTLPP